MQSLPPPPPLTTSFLLVPFLLSQYMNDTVAEISEILQERGKLTLGEICQRFSLPIDFVQLHFISLVGGTSSSATTAASSCNTTAFIAATLDALDNGSIYTQSYISRQTALVRGLFSSLTCPTPLSSLLTPNSAYSSCINSINNKYSTFPHLSHNRHLLLSVLNTLIKRGEIYGLVKNNIYTPTIYQIETNKKIDSLWKQQGFLGKKKRITTEGLC